MVLAQIGLGLIVIGWLMQLYHTVHKRRAHLNLDFVVVYATGSVLLAISAFQVSDLLTAVLQILVAGVALFAGIEAFFRIK